MVASEKETPRCKATTTTKSLFELPRPRSRSSSAKMAAEAGYWHRRAVAMQRKSVCDRQVAHTKENDLLQAKEKIVAMEKQTRSLELQIQTMMKNTSTLGAEANEEVVTLEENEDKEATLAHLQVAENTAAEAKAKRNRDWQRNFFKWWWALDPIREQRKGEHRAATQKAIREWQWKRKFFLWRRVLMPIRRQKIIQEWQCNNETARRREAAAAKILASTPPFWKFIYKSRQQWKTDNALSYIAWYCLQCYTVFSGQIVEDRKYCWCCREQMHPKKYT